MRPKNQAAERGDRGIALHMVATAFAPAWALAWSTWRAKLS